MRAKTIIKTLILAGFPLLIGVIVLAIFLNKTGYLSTTEKTDANILVVEGWLPGNGMQEAYNEFLEHKYDFIITTGVESNFVHCNMYWDGFLIFYPKEKFSQNTKTGKHLIEVRAYSQFGGEDAASFNLFVNKTIIANLKANVKEKKLSAYWTGSLSDIDSITIQFANDLGGRALYVREIIIDKKIVIPYLYHSEYDIGELDGKDRFKNDFTSYASLGKNALLRLGMNPNQIIAVSGEKTQINRTLASAVAVKKWVDTTRVNVTGMNIVSYGMHARRSWLIYSKVLGKEVKTGIVSLTDDIDQNNFKKSIKGFRETLGLMYYWIILLFY
ncbi:MAG TPA: hypothetical protein PLR88_00030 [Bacteroidales bacterium]|nr:hypothetical protein [Bacteroidales bacterium]HPT20301.1 hypothetical protein [Bacteroidales bacterium]